VLTSDNETYQKTKDGIRQKYTAANGMLSAQTIRAGRSRRARHERTDQTRKISGVECVMTVGGATGCPVATLTLEHRRAKCVTFLFSATTR
jgi:hypothetical protein